MGGFVGLDFSSLSTLFEAWGVPVCERRFVIEKLVIVSSIAVKYWNSDTPSNNSKTSSKE